jgi:3-methylcrotonyl-CoA carboxylase alpha subunit
LAAAALCVLTDEAETAAAEAAASVDPWSPWHARDHWWLNAVFERELPFTADGSPMPIKVRGDGLGWQLTMGDQRFTAKAKRTSDGRMDIVLGDVRERVSAMHVADNVTIRHNAG